MKLNRVTVPLIGPRVSFMRYSTPPPVMGERKTRGSRDHNCCQNRTQKTLLIRTAIWIDLLIAGRIETITENWLNDNKGGELEAIKVSPNLARCGLV